MTEFHFQDMFPLGPDETLYRKLTNDPGSLVTFEGHSMLKVEPEALTQLTFEAFRDISHLLRPTHLQQLADILRDPEASENDRFVALELIKNANIAAGGILPMCQDTGTAIIMGKKGQRIWTGYNDEAAISSGIYRVFQELNLRYSQASPVGMFEETNTQTNLPAQIEIYDAPGSEYNFLFIAKGDNIDSL